MLDPYERTLVHMTKIIRIENVDIAQKSTHFFVVFPVKISTVQSQFLELSDFSNQFSVSLRGSKNTDSSTKDWDGVYILHSEYWRGY